MIRKYKRPSLKIKFTSLELWFRYNSLEVHKARMMKSVQMV